MAIPTRILVLEDEPLIAMALEDWLAELGHDTVGPVASAPAALAAIAATSPDAAILDVTLRGGDSYGVAAALRERGIPFVFATGRDVAAIDARFADAPILTKPFQEDAVRRVLAALLGRAT